MADTKTSLATSLEARLAVLRGCRLFARLPAETLVALAEHARDRWFAPGDLLLQQGAAASGMFVIGKGSVRVFCQSDERQQASIAILGRGDCCGELAVLDNAPRSASAVAMDEVWAVYLPGDEFRSVVQASPIALMGLVRVLSGRLRKADEHMANLVFNDVHGRVVTTLLALASSDGVSSRCGVEIELKLSQRDLATMVGATRERVNKVLSLYRQRGLLEVRGQRIAILAPELLRQARGG